MADLKEKSEALLASVVADMQAGDGKTNLYTVPVGKSCIITRCVVRDPSGSLVGGSDFDFGDGAECTTWKQSVDLSTMTATTDYWVVTSDDTKYTVFNAGDVFGIWTDTGATADVTATIDVFGYIF